jgi:hypothetical protein
MRVCLASQSQRLCWDDAEVGNHGARKNSQDATYRAVSRMKSNARMCVDLSLRIMLVV